MGGKKEKKKQPLRQMKERSQGRRGEKERSRGRNPQAKEDISNTKERRVEKRGGVPSRKYLACRRGKREKGKIV